MALPIDFEFLIKIVMCDNQSDFDYIINSASMHQIYNLIKSLSAIDIELSFTKNFPNNIKQIKLELIS